MLETLAVEDFRPHLNSVFRAGDGSIELRLESVAAVMESERAKLKRQPFSLYFRGSAEGFLPQATYLLSHEAFPTGLTIFLVPVGRNADGYQYEAVFT